MNEEKYLTVKEFAEAAGVTTQYIYKIIGKGLKPYTKRQNKKTVINAAALDFIKNGFPLDQPSQQNATNQEQPSKEAELQPDATNNQPTNATTTNQEQNGEIEALKLLIAELKQDKEDLKKDKEDLKQEALKWQQLLLEERNKVKLLEAAAAGEAAADQEEEIIVDEIIKEDPVKMDPIKEDPVKHDLIEQPEAEKPKTFTEKLKWLFGK